MYKSFNAPYYTDFMRSETIMRCIDFEDLTVDSSIPLDNPLFIHLFDSKGKEMITCQFSQATEPSIDPGLTQKLIDNDQIGNYIGVKKGVLIIRMSQAFKRSTLNDIEERVRMGIRIVKTEFKLDIKDIDNLELDLFVWEFKKFGGNDYPMKRNLDLEDVTYKHGYEFVNNFVNEMIFY